MPRFVLGKAKLAEVVSSIAHYPEDIISYSVFDEMTGLSNSRVSGVELNKIRAQIKDSCNRQLEAGVVVDDQIIAIALVVGEAGSHYVKRMLVDHVSMNAEKLRDDIARLFDKVIRDHAFVLGEDQYPQLIDNSERRFRKESPPLSDSDIDFLKPTYASLKGNYRVLSALLENTVEQTRSLAFIRNRVALLSAPDSNDESADEETRAA